MKLGDAEQTNQNTPLSTNKKTTGNGLLSKLRNRWTTQQQRMPDSRETGAGSYRSSAIGHLTQRQTHDDKRKEIMDLLYEKTCNKIITYEQYTTIGKYIMGQLMSQEEKAEIKTILNKLDSQTINEIKAIAPESGKRQQRTGRF